jgi:hypothetical protein
MTEFSVWIQKNWFELGILFLFSATLATVVWFARNILKTFRAYQEQVGALMRLSFSDLVPVQAPVAEASVAEAPVPRDSAHSGPNRLLVFARNLVNWFQAPMGSNGVAPWRKFLRWLQAPAGS